MLTMARAHRCNWRCYPGYCIDPPASDSVPRMSWTISGTGHTASEDDERELAHRISQVLSDPKYGASHATFHGNWVHGDPRTTAGWLKQESPEPPYTEEPGGLADTPGAPRAGY